ncbi:MAG: hypothetical protein LH468_08255 [Nocardioides sp.]|nr:hypothetical protein [Nocardioides sp.]
MKPRLRAFLRPVLERHLRVRTEAERGTTMVEVVVALTIMTICGSIFTGAVVTLHKTSNQAQAITNAATQNNQAYQTLDRTVRYASAISSPGVSSGAEATGNWYVELRTTTSGAEVCTQLRVDVTGRQLQTRSWSVTSPVTPSAWVPIASGITNGTEAAGSATRPFVLPAQAPTVNRQQLRITLVSRAGPASQPVSSTSSFTLTALNSVRAPTGAICAQVARP